jgi:hypothetical protein
MLHHSTNQDSTAFLGAWPHNLIDFCPTRSTARKVLNCDAYHMCDEICEHTIRSALLGRQAMLKAFAVSTFIIAAIVSVHADEQIVSPKALINQPLNEPQLYTGDAVVGSMGDQEQLRRYFLQGWR